jgi:hypothetical protein
MRGTSSIAVVVMVFGCGGGGGGDTPDAAPAPDALIPPPPGCIQLDTRDDHTVTVSGTVSDWVTGDPIVGATVDVSTAWDVQGNFPNTATLMCPPIVSLTTNVNGQFGPALIEIGSPVEPPITIYMVTGAGVAPTASDARVGGCSVGVVDCGNQGHIMKVPSETLAATWRAELAAGGMPNAAQRGLTLFQYRELAGPAGGVEALVGTLVLRPLLLGTEVRFLNADLATLAPATQGVTLASGIAVIGIDTADNAVFVAGRRGGEQWAGLGVLLVDGWFFLEDKLVSP